MNNNCLSTSFSDTWNGNLIINFVWLYVHIYVYTYIHIGTREQALEEEQCIIDACESTDEEVYAKQGISMGSWAKCLIMIFYEPLFVVLWSLAS